MQIEDSLLDQKPKKTLFSLPTSILQRDWLPNIFLYQKPLKVSTEILNIKTTAMFQGLRKDPWTFSAGGKTQCTVGSYCTSSFFQSQRKPAGVDRNCRCCVCVCSRLSIPTVWFQFSRCMHDQCFLPLSVLSRHPGKKMRKTCGPTIGPKLKQLPRKLEPGSVLRKPYSSERKTSSDIANHRYKGFILYVFINLLLDHVLWFLMSWL